jgi:starch phosphorylase
MASSARVAYFSMEIALDERFPTYSGGLGVLAGDSLRAAADLDMPIAAVTLAYRNGYFRQSLDAHGNQTETPEPWQPERELQPAGPTVVVHIAGRDVRIAAWRFEVRGVRGGIVPVYLLDTDVEGNHPDDRAITASLYGGDARYRLAQEIVLGIGGTRMLEALGAGRLATYHMNEGHSALLVLALLEHRSATSDPLAAVRELCVFTTHTPVPAGHDRFREDLLAEMLGEHAVEQLRFFGFLRDGELNMTYLALRASRFANAVAYKHGEVSRAMFPDFPIAAITNGVHPATWIAAPMARVYDRFVPEWRDDPTQLRQLLGAPAAALRAAHDETKRALFATIAERTGAVLDPAAFTLGFARRAASYKRASLLFSDIARLETIVAASGKLQIVYAGKAHPRDEAGKAEIRAVYEAKDRLGDKIDVVYLENYEWALARQLVSGVDLWLNTPRPPEEASGTSGMKAALNGVPMLSTLDGWWIEGCVEGRTGWGIVESADELYAKLGEAATRYARDPQAWAETMRYAVAINGPHFTTQRMIAQYARDAYSLPYAKPGEELEAVG